MRPNRLDQISKRFAAGRLSRRAAVRAGAAGAVGAAGAAAGLMATGPQLAAAQGATPEPGQGEKVAYLFLQAFEAGAITPKDGEADRFTLTLERGLGQTVYFSDRPLRDVGATPTADFLDNLGFTPENPPNAALVVETAAGETEIAVVELFDPRYDEATRTATYDVAVLAEWERTEEQGFTEAAADLAAFGSSFGAAHLFIDDCADGTIYCTTSAGASISNMGTHGFCWNYATCVPCEPYYHTNPYNGAAWDWWTQECNRANAAKCNGACVATPYPPQF